MDQDSGNPDVATPQSTLAHSGYLWTYPIFGNHCLLLWGIHLKEDKCINHNGLLQARALMDPSLFFCSDSWLLTP